MALEHIETKNVSSVSSVDFTNVFGSSDGADTYIIFIDNHINETDGQDVRVRVSSDGGSNWDSGSTDYEWSHHKTEEDAGTDARGGTSSRIERFIQAVGNDASSNDTAAAIVTIYDPTDANRATEIQNIFTMHRNGSSSEYQCGMTSGTRLAQSAIDSIQFFTGNNISSGIYSVYRVIPNGTESMSHIETIDASSQSTVDFTSVFGSSDGFDRYIVYADNVIPENNEVGPQLQVSSDGGSNWDSGSSDYARSGFSVQEDGATNSSGASTDSKIQLDRSNASFGNAPTNNDINVFRLFISEPTNSNRATVIHSNVSSYADSLTNSYRSHYTGGIRLTQSAVDSIRIQMNSGNISSGSFSLYGIGQ